MASYRDQSPEKIMLNSQRLSAMIDSLNDNDDDDDHILSLSKTGSSDKKQTAITDMSTPQRLKDSPSKMRSPGGYSSANSGENRFSMISNYSGVMHEGVEVSYVVKNADRVETEEQGPTLPLLPSLESLTDKEEVAVQTFPNAKAVSRLNSTASTVSASSNYSNKTKTNSVSRNNSLRLLAVNRHQMAPSSVGSGNLASESGSSYYHHSKDEEKLPLLERIDSKSSKEGHSDGNNNTTYTAGTDSSDNYSIATSVVPPLSTSIQHEDTGVLPIRSETNSYNPTIPPRNKNRPNSRLFIRDTLDDIESQLMEQMKDPVTLGKSSNEITRTSSGTNKSDTFFSAASFQDGNDHDIHESISHSKQEDDIYLQRPLPTVPRSEGVDRNSTLRVNDTKAEESHKTHNEMDAENYDDQFEDIDDHEQKNDTPKPKNVSKKPSKKGQPTKRKNEKRRQEIRSFDVDTLSQLLNVTKGTLIGAEFSNLGIKIEEKRALERLVDSLSRLTADMVLDPARYQEGLKRLERATRALEGF